MILKSNPHRKGGLIFSAIKLVKILLLQLNRRIFFVSISKTLQKVIKKDRNCDNPVLFSF